MTKSENLLYHAENVDKVWKSLDKIVILLTNIIVGLETVGREDMIEDLKKFLDFRDRVMNVAREVAELDKTGYYFDMGE